MSVQDVKLMVVSTKFTRDFTGKTAFYVPNGLCTNDLRYATELWCRKLGVYFSVDKYYQN